MKTERRSSSSSSSPYLSLRLIEGGRIDVDDMGDVSA
jgi:hypothetical protein